MDGDCSGAVDLREFAVALDRLGLKLGKAQVQLLFQTLDTDQSGEVDIDEYVANDPLCAFSCAIHFERIL